MQGNLSRQGGFLLLVPDETRIVLSHGGSPGGEVMGKLWLCEFSHNPTGKIWEFEVPRAQALARHCSDQVGRSQK